MRKRMVQPDLFKSDKVSKLPWPTVVTWVGVWCYLDDYGRGMNDARLVKSDVHPLRSSYTEKKVRADLDRFIRDELLCAYNVNGFALIHSPSWTEHQKISHRLESKLPPCPDHDPLEWNLFITDVGGPLDKFRQGRGNFPQADGNLPPNVVEVNSDKGSSSGPEACRSVLRSVKSA